MINPPNNTPKLNAEQISNNRFAAAPGGYNPTEVDKYLDMIIEDYQVMTRRITQLETQFITLSTKYDQLVLETEKSKMVEHTNQTIASRLQSQPAVDNSKVLDRLTEVENKVYQNNKK